MDFSPPGSFIRGVLQARILEWVAISFSTGSSSPWDKTCISCLADRFFTSERPGKPFRSIREGKISGSLNSCLQEAHSLAGQTTCSTAPSEGCERLGRYMLGWPQAQAFRPAVPINVSTVVFRPFDLGRKGIDIIRGDVKK